MTSSERGAHGAGAGPFGAALAGRIAAVRVEPQRIVLTVDLEPAPLQVFLTDDTAAPAFRKSAMLAVGYQGRDITAEGLSVLGAVFDRLAACTLPEVETLLRSAGLPFTQPPQTPGGPDRDEPQTRMGSFFLRPDRSDDWERMVVPMPQYLDAAVDLGPGVAHLQHGSRECRWNHPGRVPAASECFVDQSRMNGGAARMRYSTDLSEADVLCGRSGVQLRAAIRELREQQHPTAIRLQTTCLPELLGDDPRSALTDLAGGCPVVWTAKTMDSGKSLADALPALVANAGPRQADPHAVVVLGLVDPADRPEIELLLDAVGLRAAGYLLPSLAPADLLCLRVASAAVWVGRQGWESFDTEPLVRGLQVVDVPAPYGRAATLAWVGAVAQALRPERLADALAATMLRLDTALAPTREAAAGLKVVLASGAQDLESLTTPTFYGFAVHQLLLELGFHVQRVVRLREGEDLPPPLAGIETQGIRTPEDLRRALSSADLAFSHFAADPRLAELGLRSFCQDVFGLGARGLGRAGEELLRRTHQRWSPGLRRFLSP